ncbi:sulfate/molybdate ABC transporter ATP-binding protein [Clostridium sp. Mt-5]|uniref:Sulfate/molybdate ABC transporter ATP-binding protein n=1 Tax=Clostridium moutaii TaxID=3240932 RepID=A0ABV4BW56_9CLOT
MGLYVDIKKSLPGFSLNIQFDTEDNIIGLLGASGSGKSMTLKCIAGLETPQSGKIILNEKILYDSEKKINIPVRKRRVGFLFQNYALFPNMTVSQNISFALDDMSRDKKNEIVCEKINMMHLHGLENRFPSQLSGGQQQRVAIARALAIEPEILLLDEPFSALDSHLRSKMEEKLVHILSDYNGSAVFVSHNRDEVYRICRNIAIINKGMVENYGNRDYIFENPATLATAQLTGCKNISKIKILDENTIEALDWGCILKSSKKIKSSPSYVGIRSHYITMGNNYHEENTFKCRVSYVNESPFTVAVYLDNVGKKTCVKTKALRWEITKEMWEKVKNIEQPWNICISSEKLFLI